MKDEFKDKITSEFVGLKSLVDVYGEENKTVKGVSKNVVKKKNLLIFFLIKNWEDTWKESKVNYIELKLMMFENFLRLVLMIKDMY